MKSLPLIFYNRFTELSAVCDALVLAARFVR